MDKNDKEKLLNIKHRKIHWNRNSPIFRISQIKFIITSVFVEEENNKLLALFFYNKDNLLEKKSNTLFLKIFIDNTGYYNYWVDENKWQKRYFGSIEAFRHNNIENFIFYDIKDEKEVFNFLGKKYERYNALNYCIFYQRNILNQRALIREQRISNQLDKSTQVLKMPENFEVGIKFSNFNNNFIFLNKNLDDFISGVCLECGKSFSFSSELSTNYSEMICPNCKKKKEIKWVYKYGANKICNAFYIQRTEENGIVIRVFCYELILDNNKYKYKLEEFLRSYIIFNGDKINKEIYIKGDNIWKKVRENSLNIYIFNNISNFIYTENLQQTLNGTPYQFSCLLKAAMNIKSLNPFNYLNTYEKYPYIEYLIKSNFYKLAENIITNGLPKNIKENGKTIMEFLKLTKQWVNIAQKLNVNKDELEVLQFASIMPIKINSKPTKNNLKKQKNIYISEETLKWFF